MTDKTQHTPGPWEVRCSTQGRIHVQPVSPYKPDGTSYLKDREILTVAGWGNADRAQQFANAHLCATAPELLLLAEEHAGLCKLIAAWCNAEDAVKADELMTQIAAFEFDTTAADLIAKARGES